MELFLPISPDENRVLAALIEKEQAELKLRRLLNEPIHDEYQEAVDLLDKMLHEDNTKGVKFETIDGKYTKTIGLDYNILVILCIIIRGFIFYYDNVPEILHSVKQKIDTLLDTIQY